MRENILSSIGNLIKYDYNNAKVLKLLDIDLQDLDFSQNEVNKSTQKPSSNSKVNNSNKKLADKF